jgi:glutamine synthetase adenylyltransferase
MYRNEDKVNIDIEPFKVQANDLTETRQDIDLTKDKWYTVLIVGSNNYYFIEEDDNGHTGYYGFRFFRTVEEELQYIRDKKLNNILNK